ncbi:MAG: acetolactate synthase [Hydrogenibacillus sp.]|nr:acetolactate synthase [Hydrogenibacillus sp.]
MENAVQRMTAAKAVVEWMQAVGIEAVMTVPGESFLGVLDALRDAPRIATYTCRHESGAAFMAEAYGKMRGLPAVVMATRAVGAANLAIAVHTARQDSTPLFVLLGQATRAARGREAFQEIDLEAFFQPMAKWAVEVQDGRRLLEVLRRGWTTAISGRPGPVVMAVPEDVFEEEITVHPRDLSPLRFALEMRPALPADLAEAIMARLSRAARPIVIAGGGARMSGGREALLAFAHAFELPVYVAFRRQDVFPHDDPLFAGHLGLGLDPRIRDHLEEADLIVAIGTRLSEVTTQGYTFPRRDQALVHIDIDPGVLGRVFSPEIAAVADARSALEALAARRGHLLALPWRDWTRRLRETYAAVSALGAFPRSSAASGDAAEPATGEAVSDDAAPERMYRATIAALDDMLPEDAVIANDAGNFAGWLHRYFSFRGAMRQVAPTSGAMGYGLPAAIGAKIAARTRPVVSLSGDGGFLMTVQELATAAYYRLGVIAVVYNNRLYGTIRDHQARRFPGRPHATALSDVDFVRLAESLGARGVRAETPEAFRAALAEALEQARETHAVPIVIEVPVPEEAIAVGRRLSDLEAEAEEGGWGSEDRKESGR